MMRATLFLCALPLLAQQIDLMKPGSLDLIGMKAEVLPFKGKKALKLTEVSDPSKQDTIAIVKGLEFHNGTIEVEVAGKPAAGAPESARGFIGLAFRLQGHGERYEHFYIRPTNGRANDQLRRNHSTQYESYPDYPWFRLRKEDPGKYESYTDLEPGVWTKLRMKVSGTFAQFFVNGAEQPCLIVNDLKLGDSTGGVALLSGPATEGYFANLQVSK